MPAERHALEQKVATLTAKLSEAKDNVTQWVDANKSLSLSAAEARAKNQGAGRGFLGGLLGSKFRGAMRAGASASNAAIANEVADKRARIAEGKRQAQEQVRQFQAELAAYKQELKALSADTKTKTQTKVAAAKAATLSLDLLQKLKQARDSGLLTEDEFEQKRRKLISDL
jgi:hypothetical protein